MNQFTASLWGDEAFTALLAQKSLSEIVRVLIHDTAPPAHYFALHFWMKTFGTSEASIRSLSFSLYLLTALAIFLIAHHLFQDKITALLAALLTFFNPFFFTYAFETRMYAIMAAGVTWSMYFFLKKNWPAYILATLLALYSHHFAIFALLAQSLFSLKFYFTDKKHFKPALLSQVAVAVGYAPWLYPLYLQTRLVATGFWLGTPTLTTLTQLIRSFLITPSLPSWTVPLTWTATGLVLVLKKWHQKLTSHLFLLAWFAFPILATFAISQVYTSIFYDRYLLYTIPPLILLLATTPRRLSFLPLAFLLLLWTTNATLYFTHPTKRPFRELATYVKSTKNPQDALINWNGAAHHLWESQYYGIPAPIYLPHGPLPYYTGTAQMTPEDTISTLPPAPKIGVIASEPADKIALPGYTKTEVTTFGPLTFIWFAQNAQKVR